MTRMLASVTGPQEADIAVAGGTDIIDVKDPASGGQGAVSAAAIRATVQAVGGRRPVSAVAGDLPMQAPRLEAAVREIAATGVETVKLSILPGDDVAGCIGRLAEVAAAVKLVAVFLADASPDLSLLPVLKRSGFTGAMIDTRDKAAGCLLIISACRACSASSMTATPTGWTPGWPARWSRRTCRGCWC